MFLMCTRGHASPLEQRFPLEARYVAQSSGRDPGASAVGLLGALMRLRLAAARAGATASG